MIQSPIHELFLNSGRRLIVKSNSQNVYHWKFGKESLDNIESFGDLFHNPSEILVLDSNIISMSQGLRSENYNEDQMMAITKTGTLWLLDYDEMSTIKLFSSHLSDKNITETKVYLDNFMQKLLVFSALRTIA